MRPSVTSQDTDVYVRSPLPPPGGQSCTLEPGLHRTGGKGGRGELDAYKTIGLVLDGVTSAVSRAASAMSIKRDAMPTPGLLPVEALNRTLPGTPLSRQSPPKSVRGSS